MYKHFLKRILDILLALVMLCIFSPIIIGIMIILFFANNGKPFFLQARPGKDEKLFRIVKFKTMNDKKDEHGELLPFDKRITKVGAAIRNISLDEFPQLFNVIIGDMSIVGPRPLLPKYLPLYNDHQRRRHEAKPGITGWAQVNGRNTISWEEKFEHDVWYVDNLSFWVDLKILFLTIKKVFLREGVNSAANLNMPDFEGTKSK